ncbi:hypothetical protein [Kitasatospora sp. NPDC017646]|uniref:hypothetical protein n=1 Tax=Kitasatospora sp. NPDC017646 TaxID=3364024 RepID=UPI003794AC4B
MVTSIRRAQAEREVTPNHSPESLAYLILAVLYGSSYLPAADADRDGPGEPDEAWRVLHTVLRLG